MTGDPSADPSLCRRLALRHFRIVSSIYLLALIVGTHWPRLELSGPSGAFDKLIHFFAFGLMIFCFWICNWVTGFPLTYGKGDHEVFVLVTLGSLSTWDCT